MREKIKCYLQNQHKFSSSDADKILYGLEGLLSECSKLLFLLMISLPFGYFDEVIVLTFVLLSIRSYCGGLHFSHYFSCFVFTCTFYAVIIRLSLLPLSQVGMALGLLFSLAVFSLIGPITSPMRPRLQDAQVKKYSQRVIILLTIYSALIISLETLPYRTIIYWVIVLQIFQLLCAKIARKGEHYEKVF